MTKEQIKLAADTFFEWPEGKKTSCVTLTSAILFAGYILDKAGEECCGGCAMFEDEDSKGFGWCVAKHEEKKCSDSCREWAEREEESK